jgi:hypothetical protein
MYAHANMMKLMPDEGSRFVMQSIYRFFEESLSCDDAELMTKYTDRALNSGTLSYEIYLPFHHKPDDL